MTTPEFSRTVRVETLGISPRPITIGANEEERAALAKRFDLPEIASLSAEAELAVRNGDVVATGTLKAEVTQSCVASGEPVPDEITEDFQIAFRPHPVVGQPDEEIELSEGELDVVFYDGGAVDLGEAVAETLSLALNPYPRSPEAEAALREAGVKSEEEAKGPGPLAGLKDLLTKD